MTKTISTKSLLMIAGAVFLGTSVPALAQDGEELVVTGRYGKLPDSVQSVSQGVGYADLDLSTKAGQSEFRHRIKLTARYLCEKLGESDTSSAVAPSCQDAAVKDAMARAGTLEEGFAPRGTAWVAPPAWQAPYPADWYGRYPG